MHKERQERKKKKQRKKEIKKIRRRQRGKLIKRGGNHMEKERNGHTHGIISLPKTPGISVAHP